MLNKSIHINNYDVDKKLAIHTGVTFVIHTKTKFELLYEPWEHDLIFQRCDYIELPCVAGLLTFSSKKTFFDSYSTATVVKGIVNDDSAYMEMESNSDVIDNKSFTHFFEITSKEEDVIQNFPLKRELPFVFHNGRTEIKIWDTD